MCAPDYFDVVDVKNYFMQDAVGSVDRTKANAQWRQAKETIKKYGVGVEMISGEPGIEDMVFAANAGLTWEESTGEKVFLASRMLHPSRQRETPYYCKWFRAHGYRVETLSEKSNIVFEGNGDAIWYPERRLLFGGYGHRSTRAAYEEMAKRFDIPVILLKLASKEFYHLDTCFSILERDLVLYCPEAFPDAGNAIIEQIFPRRITISTAQGVKYFTGNAFAMREQKTLIVQRGDTKTKKALTKYGWKTDEINLDEFVKSGGNVSCAKLDIY